VFQSDQFVDNSQDRFVVDEATPRLLELERLERGAR
jgi:hypothetical protein